MHEDNEHLSRIQTLWSRLLEPGPDVAVDEARLRELLLRYYRAAFRYLLGVLKEANAAEELAQDFAVRFLRGDFRNVERSRGRFRDYLKAVLRNLARDHWRTRGREVQADTAAANERPAANDSQDDAVFDASWRDELLAKAWEALALLEHTSGKPYFTALCLKAREPQVRSPELAVRLGTELNKTFTADALRQIMHRAREAFGGFLLHEVEMSLDSKDRERLEEELAELQLLDYCRGVLQNRRA
jgi:DNA-directed RNA polymerase specialized sigma24 family protein